jgi:hypothetical protein
VVILELRDVMCLCYVYVCLAGEFHDRDVECCHPKAGRNMITFRVLKLNNMSRKTFVRREEVEHKKIGSLVLQAERESS